jgi:hypothetical protein
MTRRSLAILIVAWLLFAVPFVAVGPDDVEDFYTGVVSTKMFVDSVFERAWPFWNMDSALGVPQPFRFHFITHPFSPLCRVADCGVVLRAAAAVQALLGSLFMALLVRRLASDEAVAALAGLTFLFSSSIVQPTYLDDWSTAALPEASLPILIYAAYALFNADRSREAFKWSLVLGVTSGFIMSMFFPFAVVAAVTVFFLVQPGRVLSRWPWVSVAAAVAVLICAAHVYHLAEQYLLTPVTVARDNHEEPSLLTYASSALLAPLRRPGVETSWRTIFFGGPFAIAAVVSFITTRDAALRAFKVALIVSLALVWVPESWLFNLMTHRWGYRSGVNMFGIVLGACAIAQMRRTPRLAALTRGVMALQLVALAVAFSPHWIGTIRAWIDPAVFARSERVRFEGVTAALVELHRHAPGRVAFAPRAYDLTRRFILTPDGLAPNQLQAAGVPSLYAEAHGITLDAIAPMRYAFIGISPPTNTTVTTPSTLNVLGVRYVIAMPDDLVSDGLRLVRTTAGGIRIFENGDAWPEAFFVEAFPRTPLPRLSGCGHDRFLCVDFAGGGIERDLTPITIERHPDGMTLRFAPVNERRNILVTQWYQPYWRVRSGSARLVRAGEQLVGLDIAPGEQSVTIEYLPVFRATLFIVGLLTEAGVLLLIAWLSLRRPTREPVSEGVLSSRFRFQESQ